MKPLPKAATLAGTQRALDQQRLGKKPELLARKWKRMAASPFAFLRGAAPLFDECLRREGSFAKGPTGGGSLVGDLHLENFGVFRADGGAAIFHVNDFDALRDGPWRFDVLRLLTSILLARPELKATGTQIQELARLALDGHQAGLAGKRVAPPAFVLTWTRAATRVPPEKLLGKHADGRKLVRDEKHPALPAPLRAKLPAMMAQWAASLPAAHRPADDQLRVLDARRRVAGTGSLGVERVLMLLQGDAVDDSPHGLWLLEAKEVEFSAQRVVEAMRAAVKKPPALLGAAALDHAEMVLRQLGAGEDKLQLDHLEEPHVPAMMRFLGFLAGDTHRRLARSRPMRWSPKELRALLTSARHLAAMHEDAFLEFCAG